MPSRRDGFFWLDYKQPSFLPMLLRHTDSFITSYLFGYYEFAPKIVLRGHSAILGTRRMVFAYEEGAIERKIMPIFHYVKYNLLFFPQQYSEIRASFKICRLYVDYRHKAVPKSSTYSGST